MSHTNDVVSFAMKTPHIWYGINVSNQIWHKMSVINTHMYTWNKGNCVHTHTYIKTNMNTHIHAPISLFFSPSLPPSVSLLFLQPLSLTLCLHHPQKFVSKPPFISRFFSNIILLFEIESCLTTWLMAFSVLLPWTLTFTEIRWWSFFLTLVKVNGRWQENHALQLNYVF